MCGICLADKLQLRQPPSTCLPELRRALLDEWCNIPHDQIDNLILSMPRHCKPCIASSGRHTPIVECSFWKRKKTCFCGSNRERCTSGGRGQSTSNVQASTSVRLVAEALDLPRSTVQKIMRNILRYYPYQLQLVQELLPHDFETRHLFSLQFLARLEVYPEWP
ncbi:transposable element Tcb1 transposase [Trichonephila clavipes]|nr:transposable element Tcb1 transposase [Trichonephila clavipes]